MKKINIKLLKMRLNIETDEKRRKEIEDILEKDDEELAKLYMEKYHKTIREKREEIANALKINVDDVVYDRSEKFISGNRNKFEIHSKTIKHFDIYGLNGYEIDFYGCDVNFVISKGHSIYAENINFKNLYFINCKISIHIVDDFCCENIHFLNCDIHALNFNKVIVKGNIKFLNSNFINKSVFNSCIFQDSIYFNNSHFKDYVDFHECEFKKTACFYGVKFDKTPNFSQAIFKENLNVVNTNLNFTFGDLREKITQEYEDFNKYKKEEYQKSLDKFANDFRDSFRTFKSALIKDNNFLDASNFHKYELYCKELELENKKDKTLKDKIDKWQLVFYRKLCDHHTDLLKAFHNLLIVVMLFGMFSFALDKFKQPSHIENDIKYKIVKVDSNENYIFKEHNKTTYNLLSLNIEQESDKFIKNDFVYMIVFLILVLLLLSFNIFTSIYIFGSILYLIFSFLDLLALYTHIAVIVFFVLFALKFILLDDRQRYKRGIVVAISYTVCIFTLLVKPSLLLPALGSFLDKDSNATYPLLLSLSVVYFMFAVLILFSLQKTARKNSIVPS
ncbi:pentapeptide repeat-containing protein [Campylobacter coli]|uniref:pentapeptide repeat-containing protein n=1 Tax=Campylobacter coli TaxID=195 RepID=UPI000930DA54|nr:pentapeptide repeat-containing protein [Campylobacter coli]